MRSGWLAILLLAACNGGGDDDLVARAERRKEAAVLVQRMTSADVMERVIALGEIDPVVDALGGSYLLRVRRLACIAVAAIGGEDVRSELEGFDKTPAMAPYARAGLRLLDAPRADPRRILEETDAALVGTLIERLDEDGVMARVVTFGAVEPVIAATQADRPDRIRRLACIALGKIGGELARDRLLELLFEKTRQPEKDGPLHLYAAAGLTILNDAGTAIDLLLRLSTNNPDDDLAGLGAEGIEAEYYTIDAQICEALLQMGLWEAEEELVQQMRRRHRIRVLIDPHAVLRRHTGLELPFRYNGSYADRDADADRWLNELRATRDARCKERPFLVDDPRFARRLQDMLDWLKGQSMNYRFIAQKVVLRVGRYAVPALVDALQSNHRIAQRQAAVMLGRIGDPSAAGALRLALEVEDAEARAEAVEALRKLRDTRARGAVRDRLSDADAEVRASAAAFLAEHGTTGDRAALRAALKQEQAPATVTALACALLRRGDRTVVERLIGIFVDGEQHDREAARRCLEEVAGDSLGERALESRAARDAAAREIREWFR